MKRERSCKKRMRMKQVGHLLLRVCLPLVLCGALLTCAACGKQADGTTAAGEGQKAATMDARVVNLMAGLTAGEQTASIDMAPGNAAVKDFSVRLLRACFESGKNVQLAPFSVWQVMAMAANGAGGETLTQIEDTLGLSLSDMNAYVSQYRASYGSRALREANALWLTGSDRFSPNAGFLQTNADCYGADAYRVPTDVSVCDAVNAWVNDRTNGKIPQLLKSAPDGLEWLYLVNALYFEATWQEPFSPDDTRAQSFTCEDGTVRTVDMMSSGRKNESVLRTEDAVGFIKPYANCHYAFAALMPTETTVSEYVAALTGEKLSTALRNATGTGPVCMPKFTVTYATDLKNTLADMGMPNAFDRALADFSGVGDFGGRSNHEIDQVAHQVTVTVNESGTVAAAGTAAGMLDGVSQPVVLDRPFVYFIYNTYTRTPVFIGVMSDPTL